MLDVRKITAKLLTFHALGRAIALRPLSTLSVQCNVVACRKDVFLVCLFKLHLLPLLCLIRFALIHVILGGYDLC